MKILSLDRPDGFRLSAAAEMYCGFLPGSGMAATSRLPTGEPAFVLSFRTDVTFDAIAVRLRETERTIEAEIFRAPSASDPDVSRVRAQLERMLGLEADAEAWRALGRRDETVGALQREFPGFFTAAKSSPWDAATWAVISPRTSMKQAARTKIRMSRELGDEVDVEGEKHYVFPSPAVVASLESVAGLPEEKVRRLRGLALAAQDGELDAEHLRGLGEHAALTKLQGLRGIGPWGAGHVYYRGAAPPDGLPVGEPRVLHGYAHLRGKAVPSIERFREVAEGWRPFRMWICVLLARHLAATGAWHDPRMSRERAKVTPRMLTTPR